MEIEGVINDIVTRMGYQAYRSADAPLHGSVWLEEDPTDGRSLESGNETRDDNQQGT